MTTDEFTDLNAKRVFAFSSQMENLGFERMTQELLSMLDSGAWREFKDGLALAIHGGAVADRRASNEKCS